MKVGVKISIGGLLGIFLLGSALNAQKLKRRASWEASITAPMSAQPGAIIKSISDNSPLQKAGFLPKDIIVKVDGTLITDENIWSDITYGLRADKSITIEAVRGHKSIKVDVRLNPLEKESHIGIDTYYEEITSIYGITQRTIVTKPKKEGKQPAIILIGGLSCSSIETYPGRSSNWARTIRTLVEKSDMVVMRVEKPGVGDSEGNCSESDFLMDLEGYKAAILSLKSKTYVDTTRIVVYGSSMGSALAPLLANAYNLKGIISDGTFFKTWYEHMLEIERRIRQFQGDNETQIVEKMNNYYIPLYFGMLIQKKTYEEVVNEYPALSQFNYHGPKHMYGRPVRYYHQLQDFDLAGEWERIKAPVRIMRGTNDWIMSSFDNFMILDVLKRNGHQDHLLLEYPGLDHWNTIHKSAKDSFEGKEGIWDEKTILQIVEWAQEIVGLKS